MTENNSGDVTSATGAVTEVPAQTQSSVSRSDTINTNSGPSPRGRASRGDGRPNASGSSTQRDFEGSTPEIGGVLGLRSENVSKKINYDKFCKKINTYIMKEFRGGEYVVGITKDPTADIVNFFRLRKTERFDRR